MTVPFAQTENDDISDENSLDEKIDTEPNANTIPEENIVNTNFDIEKTTMEQASEETGTVEYQEAPSASAVPVPTFTPQQPLTVPSSGIAAHSAPPQNLKTLPHGMLCNIYVLDRVNYTFAPQNHRCRRREGVSRAKILVMVIRKPLGHNGVRKYH